MNLPLPFLTTSSSLLGGGDIDRERDGEARRRLGEGDRLPLRPLTVLLGGVLSSRLLLGGVESSLLFLGGVLSFLALCRGGVEESRLRRAGGGDEDLRLLRGGVKLNERDLERDRSVLRGGVDLDVERPRTGSRSIGRFRGGVAESSLSRLTGCDRKGGVTDRSRRLGEGDLLRGEGDILRRGGGDRLNDGDRRLNLGGLLLLGLDRSSFLGGGGPRLPYPLSLSLPYPRSGGPPYPSPLLFP